ncbi:MAG: hypothetical protein WA160_06335 [Pseudobdellovibrio sp.]
MAIYLKDLLKLHDENLTKNGLEYSLGDSFLYQHNEIFKNIRNHFLKLGFTYTDKDFCHYTVLPYASLATILEEKKVPYFDNVTVLKEIEKSHPGRFKCDDLIRVKPNYTLHESTHCIVDHFFKNIEITDKSLSEESKKAFKLIMAEAFANSVESIANLPNNSIEQRLFYEVNSYAIHTKKVNQTLQQATDLIGPKLVFHLVYFSYLHSNCLFSEPNAKAFNIILELIIKDSALLKKAMDSQSVRRLYNHAFELSLDFRLQTTSFYCAFSGINTDIQKLLNIDIINLHANSNIITNFFKSFEFVFSN